MERPEVFRLHFFGKTNLKNGKNLVTELKTFNTFHALILPILLLNLDQTFPFNNSNITNRL